MNYDLIGSPLASLVVGRDMHMGFDGDAIIDIPTITVSGQLPHLLRTLGRTRDTVDLSARPAFASSDPTPKLVSGTSSSACAAYPIPPVTG